jgi:RNA-binding protein YlmH
MISASFLRILLLVIINGKVYGARSNLPQDKITKSLNFNKVDKSFSQQLIETAEAAIQNWSCEATPFVSQPDQKAISDAFRDIVGLKFRFIGGYPQAERCRK